jgi:calcineurin-like phosphoesterase family protein
MIWFTSDTHFGHQRIIELAGRPFDSVAEMNETMIMNWNAVVGEADTVFHLGDAVMGTFAENVQILGQLNGVIVLIPGNHDRVSSAYHAKPAARDRFAQMYLDQGVILGQESGESVYLYGHWFDICHYPFTDERYPELCPIDSGQWLIHGHVHEEWQINGRQINVGVDVWDFTPVSANTILDII